MLVKRWPKIRSRCLIPCHRVLAAGGKIGGFSAPGGSAAKIRMLPTCSTGDRGFAELCLVGMRVTTMLDSDRDFKGRAVPGFPRRIPSTALAFGTGRLVERPPHATSRP
jgi:hypothetical protein